MIRKGIAVLLAVSVICGLIVMPASAASYSDAYQCLVEYAMQGKYNSGDYIDAYERGIKLDDYGNYLIGINYLTRADHGAYMDEFYLEAETAVPYIEFCYVQKNEDRSTCRTSVRVIPQKPELCSVVLEISMGNQLPGCEAAARFRPASYQASTKLNFVKYYGESYAKEAYQAYLQESLSLLLEYVQKILVENGSDLKTLGFLQFDQHTVHAIDYSKDVTVYQEPRCNARGVIEYNCAICGQRILEYIPMEQGNHNWDEGVLDPAPSCSSRGRITYTCVWCGEEKYEYLPADPDAHVLTNLSIEKEPTCTEEGSQTGQCLYCLAIVTVSIPALGHAWDEGTVTLEPGCVTEGVKLFTCTRCGESREEAIPDLGGHLWTFTEVLTEGESLHESTGLYTCTRCSETKEAPLCAKEVFTDMPKKSHWAHEAIDWAYFNGLTGGTSPTTFSPNKIVTRGEVVTFLYTLKGKPEVTGTNPFSDVKKKDFYYNAVLWAVENSITGGTTETSFSPKKTCTRAEIVMFLWAAAGRPEPESTENRFEDVKEKDYFYQAVLWAVEKGVTGGMDETHFGPKADCTRAQVMTFLRAAAPILTAEQNPEPEPEPEPEPKPEELIEPRRIKQK